MDQAVKRAATRRVLMARIPGFNVSVAKANQEAAWRGYGASADWVKHKFACMDRRWVTQQVRYHMPSVRYGALTAEIVD